MVKPIALTTHARDNMAERGALEEEVVSAVRNGDWEPAKLGRQQSRMNFVFNSLWNGRQYQTKQVNPIFVEEEDGIAVVTVYVYYF